MSIAALHTRPETACALLFGTTSDDTVEALVQALAEQHVVGSLAGALTRLSRAGRHAATSQLATVAHGLLDLDLGGLVVRGWRKYADLIAAARRTVATPDSTEVVNLAVHSISATHRPSIEVLLDDVHVATVHFELRIDFVVKGLVGTVRQGRLVALHGGDCDVRATLAAEGRELANGEAHLELPVLVRLGDGIPLLHGTEHLPLALSSSSSPEA